MKISSAYKWGGGGAYVLRVSAIRPFTTPSRGRHGSLFSHVRLLMANGSVIFCRQWVTKVHPVLIDGSFRLL